VRGAFDRLKVLSVAEPEEGLLAGAAFPPRGELIQAEIPLSKKGNRLHRHWDNTTLGHITLTPGDLTVFVNSARRTKTVRGLIEKHLGSDVLNLRQTIESVEASFDHAVQGEGGGPAGDEQDRLNDTLEARAAIAGMSRRHWEAWLDERIPALGSITPRRAAKTRLGRERLTAILADIAWHNRATPRNQLQVDLNWLRRRLGLPMT
jgi:hypothetical protein